MSDSSVCRSCGAMLPLPDLAGVVACTSCGRTARVAAPSTATSSSLPPITPPSGASASSTTSSSDAERSSVDDERLHSPPRVGARALPRLGGCLAAFVVVAILGAVLAAIVASRVGEELRREISTGGRARTTVLGGTGVVLEVDEGSGGVGIVATVQETSASGYDRRLVRLDVGADGPRERWRSEPLGRDAHRVQVAAVDDTVFVGLDATVLALDADTGTERWRADVPDEVDPRCDRCFATVDGTLVVRTIDASLTAFSPGSSERLWSRRLRAARGSAWPVGDRVIVLDDPEAADGRVEAELVDPATGRTIHRSVPRCEPSGSGPWDPELEVDDVIWAAGDDAMAAFGFGDACVVRWDPATGEQRWATLLDGVSLMNADQVVVGPEDLVVTDTGGSLTAISVADGRTVQLEPPAEVRVRPEVISARNLYASTTSQRGSPRGGVAAWDLSTGAAAGSVTFDAGVQSVSSRVGLSSDALFDGSPRSMLLASAEGPIAVVFDGSDRSFEVLELDLSAGTSRERGGGVLDTDTRGTPSLSIVGGTDRVLVVSLDSSLHAVALDGSGRSWRYPSGD